MRAKRAKQYRKLMNAYALSFGFRSPLQVLLDADIIQDAARYKMNLGNMLQNTLGGYEIKPMISQCCIRHLYDAPATTEAEKQEKAQWIEVAKQAERRRCGHHELEEPLSTLACMASVIDPKGNRTNKHRYVVATQNQDVRAALRDMAGVPLVYVNRSVMILEPMSTMTENIREADERAKVRAGLKGRRGAEVATTKRKRDENGENEGTEHDAAQTASKQPVRKKVKGPKGPNPLSMKKPKEQKPKSVAKNVEDQRAVVREVEKTDLRAADKAVDVELVTAEGTTEGNAEGPKKRKRKRKPKDGASNHDADITTNGLTADE